MLINSAHDIAGASMAACRSTIRPGTRAGKADLRRAFPAGNYYDLDQTWLFTTSGGNVWSRSFRAARSKPVYITPAWTDAAGLAGCSQNDLNVYARAPLANAFFVGTRSASTRRSIRHTASKTRR
jgi:hypothetical protein